MTSKIQTEEDILEVEEEKEEAEASVTYDIASYPSDLTVSVVHEMFKNGDIIIPDYQRNFVWTIKQSSLLIESFLIGLPVPQVFFYVNEHVKNEVIDGHQRIMSIIYFLDGYFGSEDIHGRTQSFRLHGLNEDSPFAKKRYEDLTEAQQRKLKGAVLRAINIRQLHPKEESTSVYHIFERLNTGGTPLKPQEIRNCVFRGDLIGILRSLNEDENWRKIIGKETLDKHQKDVELILRIFSLTYSFEEYEKPMKEFLNVVMKREKKGTSKSVLTFQRDFPRVAATIVESLGERPFHIRRPLNAAALDAVFAAFLNHKGQVPPDIRERFEALKTNKEFQTTTFHSTSDLAVVKLRFQVASSCLFD